MIELPKSFNETREDLKGKVNDPQSLNKLWWDRLPMTYRRWDDEEREPLSKDDFEWIEKSFLDNNIWLREEFSFEYLAGKKVLEIGCGSGVASCLMAKAGAIVTAIDISDTSCRIAERNCRTRGINVSIINMDAENMAFEDDSFDYVFSWGVIHHSGNPGNILKEISRVLKRGGEGLVMVYHRNSLRYYMLGLFYLLVKGKIFSGYTLETVQSFFTDGYYHRHYSRKEFLNELNKVKLIPERVVISDLKAHTVKFLSYSVMRWLRKKFGWFLIVEFLNAK